jgi:hypothetical protein
MILSLSVDYYICYGHPNIYIHFTYIQHDNNVKTSTIMVKYLIQQNKNKENVQIIIVISQM